MHDYRPAAEETYEKVPDMQRSFGFRAIGDGQVAQRQWDCHCIQCLDAVLTLSTYHVAGCERGDTITGIQNGEVWHGCGVERHDALGVALQRRTAQGEGHKLAAKLKGKLGVFVAAQARGDNVVDFMVGMTVDASDSCPIIEQVQERSKRINNTEFNRGDYAIAVHWFHRFTGDDRRLTFVKDTYTGDHCDVVNSTELRAIAFKLTEVQMPIAPVRRSTRRSAALGALPSEPDVHYTLHADIEDAILKQCW